MIDTPRNVHAIPPPPENFGPEERSHKGSLTLPRLRAVTNDPEREYAQRPGQVEALPDYVAALILCRKGWSKVERQQIKITLDGHELLFASRESITIAEHNGTGRSVLWVLNRRAPDVLHILTDDGAYIETIPRKGEATWFDSSEASQAAYRDAKAMISRDFARMKELHRPDTDAAAADTVHNAAQVRRLVQTFPHQPADAPSVPSIPSYDRAESIAAAIDNVEHQRTRHEEIVVNTRNAARFGAFVRASETPEEREESAAEVETWTDAPPVSLQPQPKPEPSESW